MKKLIQLLCLLCTLQLNAQEIILKKTDQPVASSKYYWVYSVSRLGTAHDSLHYYTIHLSLNEQYSSSVHTSKKVKITGARINCIIATMSGNQKIKFIQDDKDFFADFSIRTNQVVPVSIVAKYNRKTRVMRLKLNEGDFPGEPDIP